MSDYSAFLLANYVATVDFRKPAALLTFHISRPHHATQHTVLLCSLFLAGFFCFIFTRNIYFFSFLVLLWLPSPSLEPNQTISLMKFESQWRKEQSRDERNYPSVCCKDLCYIMDVSCWKWIIVSMVITVASSLTPDQWGCQRRHSGQNMRLCLRTCNNKQLTRRAYRRGTAFVRRFIQTVILRPSSLPVYEAPVNANVFTRHEVIMKRRGFAHS